MVDLELPRAGVRVRRRKRRNMIHLPIFGSESEWVDGDSWLYSCFETLAWLVRTHGRTRRQYSRPRGLRSVICE